MKDLIKREIKSMNNLKSNGLSAAGSSCRVVLVCINVKVIPLGKVR